MLKKTITYTDYNGVERTEDFYFNLTKAELAEMEVGVSGGFSEMVRGIIKAVDVPSIAKIFKDIILAAYGVKSSDGKRFIKNDEVRDEFVQSEAYSELYMELIRDEEAAANFVNGLIPSDLLKDVNVEEQRKEISKNLPKIVKKED